MAYQKLAGYFKKWNFVMNLHDQCVWNKVIIDDQLPMIFHIDDVLMTHKKANVITDHIKLLDEVYAKNDPLSVTCGKIHEYLGMTIDFRVEGQIAFYQFDALKKLQISMLDELKGHYHNTLAPEDLFKVNKESLKVDNKLKE